MNKRDLIQAISKEHNLRKGDVAQVVDSFLSLIGGQLEQGGKVSLMGFGTFTVRAEQARTGRNPKTGEQIQIPAKTLPVFRAAAALKQQANDN